MNKQKILILMMILLSLSSCDNQSPTIQGSINRLEKDITVNVTTVKTESELRNLYSDLTGIANSQVPDQYGFAQWNERRDGSDPDSYNCQIYILEPKREDDEQILTLGHEMAHCIWGSYHK